MGTFARRNFPPCRPLAPASTYDLLSYGTVKTGQAVSRVRPLGGEAVARPHWVEVEQSIRDEQSIRRHDLSTGGDADSTPACRFCVQGPDWRARSPVNRPTTDVKLVTWLAERRPPFGAAGHAPQQHTSGSPSSGEDQRSLAS